MANTFSNLLYHIVFSTKHREPLITDALTPALYAYMGSIIRGERGILLAIGGMPDHIHILAKLPTDRCVAEMLRRLKAHSTKWVNEQGRSGQRFAWQTGYSAFSVSSSRANAVSAYIGRQQDRHKLISFQHEYLQLLQKHGIAYDERYLWD